MTQQCQEAVRDIFSSVGSTVVQKIGGKVVETTIEDADKKRLEDLENAPGGGDSQALKDALMELPAIQQRCGAQAQKVRKNMDADSIPLTGPDSHSFSVACAMYDICNWGDVGVLDSPNKAAYHSDIAIYPVGFEVARVMRLAVLPLTATAGANTDGVSSVSVVDPSKGHSYPFIHAEFVSKVLRGESAPVFKVKLTNETLVASSEESPQHAWQLALSRPQEIASVLGAKLRRCRAVFNRLCCDTDADTFLEEMDLDGPAMAL